MTIEDIVIALVKQERISYCPFCAVGHQVLISYPTSNGREHFELCCNNPDHWTPNVQSVGNYNTTPWLSEVARGIVEGRRKALVHLNDWESYVDVDIREYRKMVKSSFL